MMSFCSYHLDITPKTIIWVTHEQHLANGLFSYISVLKHNDVDLSVSLV